MSWLAACAGVSGRGRISSRAAGPCAGFIARQLYTRYFLKTMRNKVLLEKAKARNRKGAIDVMRIAHARDLRDFDDAYTAPMHGFRNALDYRTRASSKPWLAHIGVPTLVLNARNDPFPARIRPCPARPTARPACCCTSPNRAATRAFPWPLPGQPQLAAAAAGAVLRDGRLSGRVTRPASRT